MISKFNFAFLALLVMASCVAPLALRGQNAHESMRKADDLYDKSKFSEAKKSYYDALPKSKPGDKTTYNLGNTYYREGDYVNAVKTFEGAAKGAKDANERADAYHNLGNAYLKQEKYKEAVEAYQNSLINRPGDAQTKQNLQMAKQKKQQQEQQEQQKQQQNQNQQQQQNQNQQQNQQQQGQQNQQQQNQSQQQQGQQQQQQQQQQNQQQQSGNPHQQGDQQIPKLEQPSEQFLEAIGREDRKNKRKYQEKTNNAKPSTRRKDW